MISLALPESGHRIDAACGNRNFPAPEPRSSDPGFCETCPRSFGLHYYNSRVASLEFLP